MIEDQMSIGLVVERRALEGAWGGVAWRPITVFATAPEVAPWTPLGGTKTATRYYAGAYPISLFSTDTTNYRDNLSSGAPKLWVVLRADGGEPPVQVLLITADPAEGEGSTEAGNNIVETLEMPPEIAGAVAAFIEAHHVERPIIKRRRDGQAPDVRWRDGGAPAFSNKLRGEKS
jgi:Protein of unknown function (DUF3305)